MFGYLLETRPSAMVRSESDLVNFEVPIAFCLLPDTGLGLRAPPLLSLTLTTMIPGLALYPRRRAVGRFVGRGILLMMGSRRHVIADRRIQSLNSGVPPCHHSDMYEYAIDSSHVLLFPPSITSDKGYSVSNSTPLNLS